MVRDDLLAHVALLGWEHVGLAGDYIWTATDRAAPFRPLRDVRTTFLPRWLGVQFFTDRSVQDIMTEALSDWFAKHRLPRLGNGEAV